MLYFRAIQSAYRRYRSLKDHLVISGDIPPHPSPPEAKAMYLARRRRHPRMVDLTQESDGVQIYVQLICPNMKVLAKLISCYVGVRKDHEINLFLDDAMHIQIVTAQEFFRYSQILKNEMSKQK